MTRPITVVWKVTRTQIRNATRSRWIVVYTAFFLLLTEGLLRFSDGEAKAVLSLATVALMVVPLATLVLSTIYVYAQREFAELLLAQPVKRRSLFRGLYLGLALPMAGGFLVGVGLPFAVRAGAEPEQRAAVVTLLGVGVLLTFVFTAIAFSIALRFDDRLRGFGVALGLWLLVAVLFDGIVLMAIALFADYPIERPLLALSFANPIDLARVLLLLRLDIAALMGYTGAVFQRFFGGALGSALAATALLAWAIVPFTLGARQFSRKDF